MGTVQVPVLFSQQYREDVFDAHNTFYKPLTLLVPLMRPLVTSQIVMQVTLSLIVTVIKIIHIIVKVIVGVVRKVRCRRLTALNMPKQGGFVNYLLTLMAKGASCMVMMVVTVMMVWYK